MSYVDPITGEVLQGDKDKKKHPLSNEQESGNSQLMTDPITGEEFSITKEAFNRQMDREVDMTSYKGGSDFVIQKAPGEDADPLQTTQPIPLSQDRAEARARMQSTGEKAARGFARSGITFGTAFAENTLGLVLNTSYAIYGGLTGEEDQGWIDNNFTRTLDEWRNSARENMPLYQTAIEEQSIGVIPFTSNSANFWYESALDGLAFSGAAILSSVVPGGIGVAAAKVIGKGLTLGYNAGKNIKNAGKFGEAIKKSPDLTKIIENLGKSSGRLEDSLAYLTKSTGAAFAESGIEARDLKERMRKTLYDRLKAEKRMANPGQDVPEITQEEIDRIESQVANATNANFLVNLAIVGGSQAITFGKMLAPKYRNTKKAINDTGRKTDGTFKESTFLPKSLRVPAKIGSGMAAESFQEFSQETSASALHDWNETKMFDDPTADFTEALGDAIDHTLSSKEGQTAMLVGAIIGGGMSTIAALTGGKERKAKDQNTQAVLDAINDPGFFTAKTNAESSAQENKGVAISNQGLREDNRLKYEYGKWHVLKAKANRFHELGAYDLFMEKLDEIGSMPKEEFEKVFGKLEENENPKEAMLRLKKQAESFRKNKEIVEDYLTPSKVGKTIFDYFSPKSAKEAQDINDAAARHIKASLSSTLSDAEYYDSFEDILLEEIKDISNGELILGKLRNAARLDPVDYVKATDTEANNVINLEPVKLISDKGSALLNKDFKQIKSKHNNWKELLLHYHKGNKVNAEERAFIDIVEKAATIEGSSLNGVQKELLYNKLGMLTQVYKNRETVTEMYNSLLSKQGQRNYIKKFMEETIDEINRLVAGDVKENENLKAAFAVSIADFLQADGRFYIKEEDLEEPTKEEPTEEKAPAEETSEEDETLRAAAEQFEQEEAEPQEEFEEDVLNLSDLTGDQALNKSLDKILKTVNKLRERGKFEETLSFLDENIKEWKKASKKPDVDKDTFEKGIAILEANRASIKNQVEAQKRGDNPYKANVINLPNLDRPYSIFAKFYEIPGTDPIEKTRLSRISKEELNKGLSFKIEKITPKKTTAPAKGKATVIQGFNGKAHLGLQVHYKDPQTPEADYVLLGGIMDAGSIMYHGENGLNPVDINDNTQLAALNAGFVNNEGGLTDYGKLFKKQFLAHQKFLDSLRDKPEKTHYPLNEFPTFELYEESVVDDKSTRGTTNQQKTDLLDHVLHGEGKYQFIPIKTKNSSGIPYEADIIPVVSLTQDMGYSITHKITTNGEVEELNDIERKALRDLKIEESKQFKAGVAGIQTAFAGVVSNGDSYSLMALDLPQFTENEATEFMVNIARTIEDQDEGNLNEGIFPTLSREYKYNVAFKYIRGKGLEVEFNPYDEVDSPKVRVLIYSEEDILKQGITHSEQGQFLYKKADGATTPLRSYKDIVEITNTQLDYLRNRTNVKGTAIAVRDFLASEEGQNFRLLDIKPEVPQDAAESDYFQRLKVAATPKVNFYIVPEAVKPVASDQPVPSATVDREEQKGEVEDHVDNIEETPSEDQDPGNIGTVEDEGESFLSTTTDLEREALRQINIGEIKNNLRRFINVDRTFSVEELETIQANLDKEEIPLGLFVNSSIKLASLNKKGTEYHEAFHGVVNVLLDYSEYQALIDSARKNYKKPTEADLSKLKRRYVNKGLSPARLEEIYYEEKAADAFQEYIIEQDDKPWFKRIFDRIINFLKSITGNKDYIDQLFNDIYIGKFKNSIPVRNNMSGKELLSTLTTIKKAPSGKFVKATFSQQKGELISRSIAHNMFKRYGGNISSAMSRFEDFVNSEVDKYYHPDSYSSFMEGMSDAEKKSKTEAILEVRRVFKHDQVKDENLEKLKTLVRTKLENLIEVTLLDDYLNTEDELGERGRYDQEVYLSDHKNKVNKVIQHLIDSLLDVVDEFGFGEKIDPKNPLFIRPVDSYNTYTSLFQGLAGNYKENLLDQFKIIAENSTNPHIDKFYKSFITALVKELKTNAGESQENVLRADYKNFPEFTNRPIIFRKQLQESTYYNSFVKAFYLMPIDFGDAIIDKDTGNSAVVFAASRNQADYIIKQWREEYIKNPIKDITEAISLMDNIAIYLGGDFFYSLTDPESEDNFSIEEEEYLTNLQNYLRKVGLYVSKPYLKYSIIHNLLSDKRSKDISQDERLKELSEFFVSKSHNFYPLTSNMFTDTKRLRGVFVNNVKAGDNEGLLNTRKGVEQKAKIKDAVSLVTRIAIANSSYDPSQSDTTLQDAEGKKIHPYIPPSFYTEEIMNWRRPERKKFLTDLKKQIEEGTLDDETNIQRLEQLMEQSESSLPMEYKDNPLFYTWYYNSLKFNPYVRLMDINSIIDNFDRGKFILAGSLRLNLVEEEEGESTAIEQKKYKGATPHKSFDNLEKAIYDFAMQAPAYRNKGLKGIIAGKETTLAPVVAGINEAKSMNNILLTPKLDLYTNKGVTQIAKEMTYSMLQMDYEKVKLLAQEKIAVANENSGEDSDPIVREKNFTTLYHFNKDQYEVDSEEYNFIKELEAKAINQEDIPVLEGALENFIENHLERKIQDEITIYSAPHIGMFYRGEDNQLKSEHIPTAFRTTEEFVDTVKVNNFFLNTYLNNLAIKTLIEGDPGWIYKDASDQSKRASQRLGGGTPLGAGKANIFIEPEIKEDVTIETNQIDSSTESLPSNDGQAEGSYYSMVKYLKSEGLWKYNSSSDGISVPTIYSKKIRRGVPLTSKEQTFLENEGALFNPLKLVFTGTGTFYKLSVAPLSREEVSYKDPNVTWDKVNEIYDRLEEVEARYFLEGGNYEDMTSHIYDELFGNNEGATGVWLPINKERHDRLNKMEREYIHYNMDASASKMFSVINQKITHPFNGIRKQQETSGDLKTLKDPTQKLANVWTEHLDSAVSYFNGQEASLENMTEAFTNIMADRVNRGFNQVKELIISEEGKAEWKNLFESFAETAENTGASVSFQEMLKMENGKPEYDPNFPMIWTKIQSMFLSYVSKGSLRQDVKGTKLYLRSDYLFSIPVDENDNPVDLRDQKDNPQDYIGYERRKLAHRKWDEKAKRYITEIAVSESFLKKFGLDIGDALPEKLAHLFGVRIPTEDKRSMGNFKIVNLLPSHYGKMVIVPKEIILLSGADFDIDALYVQYFSTYTDKNTRRPVKYGEYLNSANYLANAFIELKHYIPTTKKYKTVKEAIELRNTNLKALDKNLRDSLERVNKDYPRFTEDVLESIDRIHVIASTLPSLQRNIILKTINSNEFIDSNPLEKLYILRTELRQLKQLSTEEEVRSKVTNIEGIISTLNNNFLKYVSQEEMIYAESVIGDKRGVLNDIENEAFEEITGVPVKQGQEAFDKKYGRIIRSNVTAYRNGKPHLIKSFTIEESSNHLLDLAMGMLHYEENIHIAHTKSSSNDVKAIHDKYFVDPNGLNLPDIYSPRDAASAGNMLLTYITNTGSKSLTGVAAAQTGIYAHLAAVDAKVPSSINPGKFVSIARRVIGEPDYFTQSDERVLANIATLLATFVDDVKSNYSPKLNISPVNAAGIMALSIEVPLAEAIAINKQPINEIATNLLTQIRNPLINTTFRKDQIKKVAMQRLRERYPKPEQELTDPSADRGNKWDNALTYGQGLSSLTYDDFIALQREALNTMSLAIENAETIGSLRKVTSLVKGDKSSFAELRDAINSIYANGFTYDVEGNPTITKEKLSPWEESLNRFYNLPHIKTNLQVAREITEDIGPKFFILQSPYARTLVNAINKNTAIKQTPQAQERLEKQAIAYLMLRAEYHRIDQKIPSMEELHFSDSLQQRITDLLNTEEFEDNAFLNYLYHGFDSVKYNTGQFKGKTHYMIKGDARQNPNSAYFRNLIDSFLELGHGSPVRVGTEVIKPKQVAADLIAYLLTKDAFEFKSDSFAPNILPVFFKNSVLSLKKVQEAINTGNFNEVFGESHTAVSQKFVDIYNRYKPNIYDLSVMYARFTKQQNDYFDNLPDNIKASIQLESSQNLPVVFGQGGSILVRNNSAAMLANAIIDKGKSLFTSTMNGISVPTHFAFKNQEGRMTNYQLDRLLIKRNFKEGTEEYLANYKDKTAKMKNSQAPYAKNTWEYIFANNVGNYTVQEAMYKPAPAIGSPEIYPYFYADQLLEDDFNMNTENPEDVPEYAFTATEEEAMASLMETSEPAVQTEEVVEETPEEQSTQETSEVKEDVDLTVPINDRVSIKYPDTIEVKVKSEGSENIESYLLNTKKLLELSKIPHDEIIPFKEGVPYADIVEDKYGEFAASYVDHTNSELSKSEGEFMAKNTPFIEDFMAVYLNENNQNADGETLQGYAMVLLEQSDLEYVDKNQLSLFNYNTIEGFQGVDLTFEQNPKLSEIGTQEQYSQYLETIFPESKVKDIVYHGTQSNFDNFDKANVGKSTLWGKNDQGQHQGFYFTSSFSSAKTYGKVKPILLNIQNPGILEQRYDPKGLGKGRVNIFKDLQKLDPSKYDGLIAKDIYDPKYYEEGQGESVHGDTFVAFEPEQIHILGSKQDIEGFKEFISKEKYSIENIDYNTIEGFQAAKNQVMQDIKPLENKELEEELAAINTTTALNEFIKKYCK